MVERKLGWGEGRDMAVSSDVQKLVSFMALGRTMAEPKARDGCRSYVSSLLPIPTQQKKGQASFGF